MKKINLIEMLQGCSKRNGTTFRQSNPDGQPTVKRQSRLMSHQGNLKNLAMIFAVLVMSMANIGTAWGEDITITPTYTNRYSTMPYGLVNVTGSVTPNSSAVYSAGSKGGTFTLDFVTTKSDMYIKSVTFNTVNNGTLSSADGTITSNVLTVSGDKDSVRVTMTSTSGQKGSLKITNIVVNTGSNDVETLTAFSVSTGTVSATAKMDGSSITSAVSMTTTGSASDGKLSIPNNGTITFTSSSNILYIAFFNPDNKILQSSKFQVNSTQLTTGTWSGSAKTVEVSNKTGAARDISHIWVITESAVVKDYTVTAATNNVSYGSAASSASSLDEGETATITATPEAGYSFVSWAVLGTGATLSSTSTNPTKLTMGSANATVTATFGPKSYTVTLNNQSATSAGTESVTTTYNASTNLTSAITCPTKTGKVFAGYFTAANGGGTQLIDPAGNWIASAGGGSTYLDASKNWKNDGNLTLYACWMEYANSLDLQNYVETSVGSSAGDAKTSTTWTYLTGNNYICSLSGSTALDNSSDAAYRGLKFKNSGDYILFLVPANYSLSVKWGYVKSTKPKYSINGGAAQTFTTLSTSADNSSSPGDIEISSQSYIQLVKLMTSDGNATVLKKVTITAPACTTPTASWSTAPADGVAGGTMSAALTTNYAAGAVYTSSNPSVATVSGDGTGTCTITYVSAGSARITAAVTGDGEDYCDDEVSCYTDITVTAAPRTFVSGQKIYFKDASGNISGLDCLWKVSSGNVYAYFYDDAATPNNAWSTYGDMVSGDWNAANAIYEITVPQLESKDHTWTGVIFTRGSAATWGSGYFGQQTSNQEPSVGQNMFIISTSAADGYGKYNGSWNKYAASPALVGDFNNWDPDANVFGDYSDNVGTAFFTLSEASHTYKFKVLQGETWYGFDNSKAGWTITATTTTEQQLYSNNDECQITSTDAGEYMMKYDKSTNKFKAVYYPDERLPKNTYVYFDARNQTNWNSANFDARFGWQYYDSGTEQSWTIKAKGTALENWVYYAQVPNNDYIGRIQMKRLDPSNNETVWCTANVVMSSSKSSAAQNCIKEETDKENYCDSWTPQWTTYCPPMSSATLTDNSTTVIPGTAGDGTSANPYLIVTGTTINVTASATKAVDDDNMTKTFDFTVDDASPRLQSGTGNTYSYSSTSTNNHKYEVKLETYNAYNSTTGTKSTLKLYYTALDSYTVSYSYGTEEGVTGSQADDTKYYGLDLTLPGAVFSKTGYNQTGWATSQGGDKAYDLSATDYDVDDDATLYPVWTAKSEATAYEVSGSDGGNYCSGGSVTITLANSTTGISYQLYKNGVASGDPKNGSTGDAITWTGITAEDTYTVKSVENTTYAETAMTGSVTVTEVGTTTITASPSDKDDAVVGVAANISVTATGGSLEYEWQVCDDNKGTNATAITSSDTEYSGYTTATLTYTAASVGTTYVRCKVSGFCGDDVYSDVAEITAAEAKFHVTYAAGVTLTSGDVPEDDTEYEGDGTETVTVAGNTGSMVYTGYTFRGWTYDGTFYTAGQTFTMPAADVELTAVWEGAPVETVIYQGSATGSTAWTTTVGSDGTNSGFPVSSGSSDPYACKWSGTSSYLRINPRTSYSFAAGDTLIVTIYNSNSSAKTIGYKVGGSDVSTNIAGNSSHTFKNVVTAGMISSGHIDLYRYSGTTGGYLVSAKVGRYVSPNFTVSFANKTGFAGTTTLPDTIKGVPSGKKVLQPSNPSATGYTFGGWYANAACTSEFSFSGTITKDTTVYAKWTAKTTTLTFDSNTDNHGTTGDGGATATYDGTTLTSVIHTTAESGYALLGYYTTATDSPVEGEKIINADGTLVKNTTYTSDDASPKWKSEESSLTLYARYDVTYSITYDKNGATSGTAPSDATDYMVGATVTVKDTTGCTFVYAGHVFRGWNTADDGSGDYYAPGDKFSISGNTTLYAVWVEGTAGTVTYNLATISSSTTLDDCTSATPTSGDLTASTTINTYGTADCDGTASAKTDETQKLKIDAEYTAANYYEWTCAVASGKTFTPSQVVMKFQAVSGLTQYKVELTDGTTSYDSAFVQTSSAGGTLETLTWNIAEGNAFAGGSTMRLKLWAYKKESKATAFRLGSPITIKGIIAPETYTITYKDKGDEEFSGSHTDSPSAHPTSHIYGSATTLNSATKTGYSFGGWFDNEDCTGDAVTSLGATDYTADITLYAKWTPVTLTFVGKAVEGKAWKDSNWHDPECWSPQCVPTIEHDVIIQYRANLYGPYTSTGEYGEHDYTTRHGQAKSIVIDKTAWKEGDPDLKLSIWTSSSLIVAEGITVKKEVDEVVLTDQPTTPEDLYIETSILGNGSLICGSASSTTQATYDYYTRTYKYGSWYINQYVGIPFASMDANQLYGFNIYEYDAENDAWKTPSSETLEGFKAYNYLRKYSGGTWTNFDLQGTLNLPGITGDGRLHTFTCGSRYNEDGDFDNEDNNGDYLFANSWTAPIDIASITAADFSGEEGAGMEHTIYIFNAGYIDPENSQKTLGDLAGTWTSFPIVTAALGMKNAIIPATQAFCVTAKAANATLTLDYKKHVYDPAIEADSINIFPTRAPRRAKAGSELSKIRIMIRRDSTLADQLYLFERADFSNDFDNGCDGRKIFGSETAPQLYTKRGNANLAVDAVPDVEGTVVGFRKGSEDSQYTISFEYNGDKMWYLNDLKTRQSTLISPENMYQFTSYDGDDEIRFIISGSPIAEVPTEIEGVSGQTPEVRKVVIDQKVYIIRNGRMYDPMGKMVK